MCSKTVLYCLNTQVTCTQTYCTFLCTFVSPNTTTVQNWDMKKLAESSLFFFFFFRFFFCHCRPFCSVYDDTQGLKVFLHESWLDVSFNQISLQQASWGKLVSCFLNRAWSSLCLFSYWVVPPDVFNAPSLLREAAFSSRFRI